MWFNAEKRLFLDNAVHLHLALKNQFLGFAAGCWEKSGDESVETLCHFFLKNPIYPTILTHIP
jgi:hypothetical protein